VVSGTIRLTLGGFAAAATLAAIGVPAAAAAPRCFGEPATMVGTNAGETLDGTGGDDVIVGRGGFDHINGLGGADLICGGSGGDLIEGGDERDRLDGGPGPTVEDPVFPYGQFIGGGPGRDVIVDARRRRR
jgi:Ca2+-binding RTX toxin-like protein